MALAKKPKKKLISVKAAEAKVNRDKPARARAVKTSKKEREQGKKPERRSSKNK